MDDIVAFLDDVGLKSPKEVKFIQKIGKWAANSFTQLMVFLFTRFMMSIITPYIQHIEDKLYDLQDKADRLVKKFKKIIKIIKQIIKIIKEIVKAAIKIIKTVAQLYLNFASPVTWVVWGITLIVIILVFFAILFGRFGTFEGEIVVDFDTMREMNQDESQYTDLLNTAALREAFYDSVADTSFYQTFNLTDMEGGNVDLVANITLGVTSLLTGEKYDEEDFYASKKCVGGSTPSCIYANGNINKVLSQAGLYIPQLDNRYQITDASMNPAKYLIQAEGLGVYSDSYGLTSYFRDYWNREENFSLNADFLYELNRWVYETDKYPTTEQIVYPEAFVQPVSFVDDYLRIQNDKTLDSFGDPYVYVTQRVTLEDIQDPQNEYYGDWSYEGLIKSTPSDIIYDYAIIDTNDYDILESTDSQNQVNIGNVSKYMTYTDKVVYDDDTYDETEKLVRLYWIVNPYYMDMHMAEEIKDEDDWNAAVEYVEKNRTASPTSYSNYTKYYLYGYKISFTGSDYNSPYIGPFYGMHIDGKGNITFDGKLTEGYSLVKNDNKLTRKSTSSLSTEQRLESASYEDNKYPSKHYQLAQIADENGNIIVSSRNLINKTYLKTKTIRSAYRHSDEYWDGFEDFVNDDLDRAGYVGVISNSWDATFVDQCIYKQDSEMGGTEDYYSLYYCPAGAESIEDCQQDSKIYSEKKCSIVRYYNQNSVMQDLEAKLKNFFIGEEAEMEADAESIYHILRAYEDYLMETGTEGIEWEYKYYTNSVAEAEKAAAEFSNVTANAGLLGLMGVKEWFETDKDRYKDTFDAVVELNESRAISTEYTPIAIVSSDATSTEPSNVELDNGVSWGWKLVKQTNGSYKIQSTYGETSLQFPDYFDENAEIDDGLMSSALQNILLSQSGSTNANNLLLKFFFNTDYAENTYGGVNFAYKWQKDASGNYELVHDNDSLSTFYANLFIGVGQLPDLGASDDDTANQDIRNTDQAWNPDANVWRPIANEDKWKTSVDESKTASLVPGTGRVTSKEDPEDYYAMELKSVRDYGLASVLSYIEGRKVTFISGLAVTETFDLDGAKKWFEKYYSDVVGLSGTDLNEQVTAALAGFYPSDLLNESVTVYVDGAYRPLTYYVRSRKLVNTTLLADIIDEVGNLIDGIFNNPDDKSRFAEGASIHDEFSNADLAAIADGLNKLQGTGSSILECAKGSGDTVIKCAKGTTSDGLNEQKTKYKFTVSYATGSKGGATNDAGADGRFVLVVNKKDPGMEWSNWTFTNIDVAIPYLTQNPADEALSLLNPFNYFFGKYSEDVTLKEAEAAEVLSFLGWTAGCYSDDMAIGEKYNQFFNPMGHYLSWYDFNSGAENDTFLETVGNILENKYLVSKYDNKTAQTLRVMFGQVSAGYSSDGNFVTLADVATVRDSFWGSNAFTDFVADIVNRIFNNSAENIFEGAGKYVTNSVWNEFYENYSDYTDAIDLLDRSKTSSVYLIEEAVTFLGNFIYTYDTRLLLVGDINGSEKIVADLVFADRYYAITNYIFAVPAYTTEIIWSDPYTSEKYTIENFDANNLEASLDEIQSKNPCLSYSTEEGFVNEETFWTKIKKTVQDNFENFLYDLEQYNILQNGDKQTVLSNYCTSNFYYKEGTRKYDITKYTYTPTSVISIETNLSACSTTVVEASGDRLTLDECTSSLVNFKIVYTKTRTQYTISSTEAIKNVDANKLYQYRSGKSGSNYIRYSTKQTSISDASYYWQVRYGKAIYSGRVNGEAMIYIDTANEVANVYNELNRMGASTTANKLFIGSKIYESIDASAPLWLDNEKIDLVKYHQNYANPDNPHNSIDRTATNSDMYGWCTRSAVDGATKCLSASYGDDGSYYNDKKSELSDKSKHYGVYSYELFSKDEGTALLNKIGNTITWWTADIADGFDVRSNLEDRVGYTMNLDPSNISAYLDDLGYIDDTVINTTSSARVPLSNYTLSEQDLTNIAQAIYNVYGADYETDSVVALGKNQNLTPSVSLGSAKDGYIWYGTDWANAGGSKEKAPYDTSAEKGITSWADHLIQINGRECVVSYYFANIAMTNNRGISQATIAAGLNGDYYSYRDIMIMSQVTFKTCLTNDWRIMLVGFETAERQNFGTPIALETSVYGSRKQISPVQTASYFNEEVYSDWVSRLTLKNTDTYAKSDFVLNYSVATQSYLYDYVMNFETYVPLGVMSDADLTTRGADAYTSIGSNANRSFAYTASYMTQIKQYLNTPGWQSILENYRTEPATILGGIKLGFTSEEVVTEDTMVQYIAGLIETTFQYAPSDMLEYYIEHVDSRILRDAKNYKALTQAMYESSLATNKTEVSSRKVNLGLDGGGTVTVTLLYYGPGTIFASSTNETLSTDSVASDVPGFGSVSLSISNTSDDRLDVQKALQFVTIKFGKLLYKYGNVSSATMAYFYGEEYWDAMLLTAKAEGVSTGPEWHNDDPELIKSAIDRAGGSSSSSMFVAAFANSDTDVLEFVFTAEVVDYCLSYISDSETRIFLIQNSTNALGTAAFSVGSLAEASRQAYETLKEDGITVYLGEVTNNIDQYTVKYEKIDEYARVFKVDVGILMSVIMASTDLNPCYGLGTCEVSDGDYELTSIKESKDNDKKLGILGLPTIGSTSLKYSSTDYDYAENCDELRDALSDLPGSSVSYGDNKCSIKINVDYKTKNTKSINAAGFWDFGSLDLHNDMDGDAEDAVIEYFETDSRFANNGVGALIYVLKQLSEIYNQTGQDTLETLFVYFYGESELVAIKEKAFKKGFGANWYAYYAESVDYDNSDYVVKALNYYDATLEDGNTIVIENNGTLVTQPDGTTVLQPLTEYSTTNLSGKTVVRFFFDETYRKNVTETKKYEADACEKTTTGVCSRTYSYDNESDQVSATGSVAETLVSDLNNACSVSSIRARLEEKGKTNVTVNGSSVSLTEKKAYGNVTHTITMKAGTRLSADQVGDLWKKIVAVFGDLFDQSTFENSGTSYKEYTYTVTYDLGHSNLGLTELEQAVSCYIANTANSFALSEINYDVGGNTWNLFDFRTSMISGTLYSMINSSESDAMSKYASTYLTNLFNLATSDSRFQNGKCSVSYTTRNPNEYNAALYNNGAATPEEMEAAGFIVGRGLALYRIHKRVANDYSDGTVADPSEYKSWGKVVNEPVFSNRNEAGGDGFGWVYGETANEFPTKGKYWVFIHNAKQNPDIYGDEFLWVSNTQGFTVTAGTDTTYYENLSVSGIRNEELDSSFNTTTSFSNKYATWMASVTPTSMSGKCSYSYTAIDVQNNVPERECVCSVSGCSSPVFTVTNYKDEGLYFCKYKISTEVEYGNDWELSVEGFSLSAFSLFGDTSAYNEYTEDKIAEQNSGIEVYAKASGQSRDDVDVIITSTFATETKFNLTAIDYSIFAFFQNYSDYADDTERSWISVRDDLVEMGQGTDNDTLKNELWDVPALFPIDASPVGSRYVTILEQYGYEQDVVNGGLKMNTGIKINATRGTQIKSMFSGTVTGVGYNTAIGNYVEITKKLNNNDLQIVSATNGDRYQITGVKVVYGHLLDADYTSQNYGIRVNKSVSAGTVIGESGNSGVTAGDRLYIAIYLQCNILDSVDNVEEKTGWLTVDPEKYFTSEWDGSKFTINYN